MDVQLFPDFGELGEDGLGDGEVLGEAFDVVEDHVLRFDLVYELAQVVHKLIETGKLDLNGEGLGGLGDLLDLGGAAQELSDSKFAAAHHRPVDGGVVLALGSHEDGIPQYYMDLQFRVLLLESFPYQCVLGPRRELLKEFEGGLRRLFVQLVLVFVLVQLLADLSGTGSVGVHK